MQAPCYSSRCCNHVFLAIQTLRSYAQISAQQTSKVSTYHSCSLLCAAKRLARNGSFMQARQVAIGAIICMHSLHSWHKVRCQRTNVAQHNSFKYSLRATSWYRFGPFITADMTYAVEADQCCKSCTPVFVQLSRSARLERSTCQAVCCTCRHQERDCSAAPAGAAARSAAGFRTDQFEGLAITITPAVVV